MKQFPLIDPKKIIYSDAPPVYLVIIDGKFYFNKSILLVYDMPTCPSKATRFIDEKKAEARKSYFEMKGYFAEVVEVNTINSSSN